MTVVGGGGVLSGQQVRVVSVHPSKCGRMVRQQMRVGAGGGWVEPDRRTMGCQEVVGGVRGVEVEVDHPLQCRAPHRL